MCSTFLGFFYNSHSTLTTATTAEATTTRTAKTTTADIITSRGFVFIYAHQTLIDGLQCHSLSQRIGFVLSRDRCMPWIKVANNQLICNQFAFTSCLTEKECCSKTGLVSPPTLAIPFQPYNLIPSRAYWLPEQDPNLCIVADAFLVDLRGAADPKVLVLHSRLTCCTTILNDVLSANDTNYNRTWKGKMLIAD